MACSGCDEYLDSCNEILRCLDCGQVYVLQNSVFKKCRIKFSGNNSFLLAYPEGGARMVLDPEELIF